MRGSYWMYSWFCGVPGSKTWFLPQTQKSPNLPELFSMGRGRATSKHHEAKTKKTFGWEAWKLIWLVVSAFPKVYLPFPNPPVHSKGQLLFDSWIKRLHEHPCSLPLALVGRRGVTRWLHFMLFHRSEELHRSYAQKVDHPTRHYDSSLFIHLFGTNCIFHTSSLHLLLDTGECNVHPVQVHGSTMQSGVQASGSSNPRTTRTPSIFEFSSMNGILGWHGTSRRTPSHRSGPSHLTQMEMGHHLDQCLQLLNQVLEKSDSGCLFRWHSFHHQGYLSQPDFFPPSRFPLLGALPFQLVCLHGSLGPSLLGAESLQQWQRLLRSQDKHLILDLDLHLFQNRVPVVTPQLRWSTKAIDRLLRDVVGLLRKHTELHEDLRWFHHQHHISFLFPFSVQERRLHVQDSSCPLALGCQMDHHPHRRGICSRREGILLFSLRFEVSANHPSHLWLSSFRTRFSRENHLWRNHLDSSSSFLGLLLHLFEFLLGDLPQCLLFF